MRCESSWRSLTCAVAQDVDRAPSTRNACDRHAGTRAIAISARLDLAQCSGRRGGCGWAASRRLARPASRLLRRVAVARLPARRALGAAKQVVRHTGRAIGLLPRELRAPEVPVRGGRLVHGHEEAERLDERLRPHVEGRPDVLLERLVAHLARAEGVDVDADGLRHADGVGDLHLAALGDAGRDHVLGDVARVVAGAAVDLARVLPAEGTAAVTTHAAVGVHDDLATRQAAVALGPPDDEAPGRVDVHLGRLVDELLRERLVDDQLDDRLAQLLVLDAFVVLRADHDGVDANRHGVLVLERDLRLSVGAQEVHELLLADRGELTGERVRVLDGRGHELGRLIRGIAEHEALVAGALLLVQPVSFVHTLGDVGALALDGREHRARGRIESHRRVDVTDVPDRLPNHLREVDLGGRRDLARNDHHSGLGERLASDPGPRVLRQDGVEDRVGDLIAELVGVALGDGLGGETVAGHAGASYQAPWARATPRRGAERWRAAPRATTQSAEMPVALEHPDRFVLRHVGPDAAAVEEMLRVVGAPSLDALIDETIPASIRLRRPLALPAAKSEFELLEHVRAVASKNQVFKSFLGMGYSDCVTPPVIQRNILENAGWYTQYTPYQAEVSQGRLEALLNFQTMVSDLCALEIANASLLDEATAAAEAMHVMESSSAEPTTNARRAMFVSDQCHPQTIDVLRTRAAAHGIAIVVADAATFDFASARAFGALLQYPSTDG